ncbi:MAG: excinuclease ABC subunit UvrA [Lentisphaeria bacterium]|jgi:excinuclease ABC subunit A
MADCIHIVGARQHNLKNIEVSIPRNRLTVVTGLSGSGKSSLAFDTLYAEGQRRYVESLSAYARQFLDRLQKPEVDHIEGLSPAIAIEQRSAGSNPRSIVATTTEIYDYLRLLYAHVAKPHCPKCGRPIARQSAQAITDRLAELPPRRKLMLLAPYVSGKKGEHREILEKMRRDGFVRARIDGQLRALDEEIRLEKNLRHTLEAVVDRLVTGDASRTRLTDSVELALRVGGGLLRVLLEDAAAPGGWGEELISEHLACAECGVSFGELEPRNFSFNSPYGACPVCNGLGARLIFLPEKVVPDPTLSIRNGALPLLRRGPRNVIMYYNHLLRCLAEQFGFSLTTPWRELPEATRRLILHGSGGETVTFDYWMRGKMHQWRKPWDGVLALLLKRYNETEVEEVRERLQPCMGFEPCSGCHGARLKPESLAATLAGKSLWDFCSLSVAAAVAFGQELESLLTDTERRIAGEILKEVRSRLGFLQAVGLGYLTLARESGTLSGGEAQRIRLATQVGSGLVGVLYILDEPSIGLHQRDNAKLLDTLGKLRDAGNTVVVVEHDLETIERADYIVDLGPGAGRLGGEVVAAGTPAEVARVPASLTGQFLSGARRIPLPERRQAGNGHELVVRGARENNLKGIDVRFPLGQFICVTGVSGSGKSTLVHRILRNSLLRQLQLQHDPVGAAASVEGMEHVDKLIVIDQSPIGRTPRSNPATYTEAFGLIRDLFAKVPDARARGYKPGRFSFNAKGGRCEDCQGAGIKKIEMQFLPDVFVPCEACGGKRYNQETLAVKYRGRSIADVLDLTVDDACEFFAAVPAILRKIRTLQEVGLGYIHLGQAATTLSGGEAQRVKLATELARKPTGHTLYILDEPTTGLHLADIGHLLGVLQALRDQGNTILVIEHNLDVIKVADHLIDLGPEGGDAGGTVVATGTPEQVAECAASATGQYLKQILDREGRALPPPPPPPRSAKPAPAAPVTTGGRTSKKAASGTARAGLARLAQAVAAAKPLKRRGRPPKNAPR